MNLDNAFDIIPYANQFMLAASFLFLCTVLAHWLLPSRQPLPISRKLFDTVLSLAAIALWYGVLNFQSRNVWLFLPLLAAAFFLSYWTSLNVYFRFQKVALGATDRKQREK